MATEPNRTEPNRTEIIHDLENNFTKNKILQLKTLFPEAFCEEQIDWEKLKLILGADNLAHQNERYQLNWAGKTEAYRTLQAPTFNTLSPCREESVDFDRTRNLFIEAENLDALKILQKAYAGSVKMIYIDPPYNTGSDSFIYPDKFAETREEYARRVGDKDSDGYLKRDGVFQGAWRKNPRENGHYHSNWLSMMLPRLHLARTLLRDDGVIFISIDDNEQAQLKLLCDEVFGAENFISQITIQGTANESNEGILIQSVTESCLCYGKNKNNSIINKIDAVNEDWRSLNDAPSGLSSRKFMGYTIYYNPQTSDFIPKIDYDVNGDFSNLEKIYFDDSDLINNGYVPIRPSPRNNVAWRWRWGIDTLLERKSELRFRVNRNKKWEVEFKQNGFNAPRNYQEFGTGTLLLKSLFDSQEVFAKPKSVDFLSWILEISSSKNDLVLDFFSGSGTLAHAVMKSNIMGDNRRYICIQLPEDLDTALLQATTSEAKKTIQTSINFLDKLEKEHSIAEIAKERIRRAGAAISGSLKEGQSVDTGFKVFKLSESSFKQWRQPENGADLEQQLRLAINSVAEHAAPENMVYELMLRLGCKLTSPVEHKNGVYWVTDEDTGKRIALLLEAANQTLIDEVIAAAPAKVVALDKWFDGNDALKSNTVLQMKDAGIVFECV